MPGFFSQAALRAAGPVAQRVVVAALVLSNWQTFVASMSQAAHTAAAMAAAGLLPRQLAATGDRGAPVAATALAAFCAFAFLFMPFGTNLGVQSIMYASCSGVLALAAVDLQPPFAYLPTSRPARAALMLPALLAAAAAMAAQGTVVLAGVGGSMVAAAALCAAFPPAIQQDANKPKEQQHVRL